VNDDPGMDEFADDEVDANRADDLPMDIQDEVNGNRVSGGRSRALLDYLARALVDDPEAVLIDSEDYRGTVTHRLHVGPSDMGRVIGRRGRTAQAIRTLVGAASVADGAMVRVDIVD